MTNKKLEKPVKTHIHDAVLDYHDMVHYVEQKYNISIRNFGRKYHNGKMEDHYDTYQRVTKDKLSPKAKIKEEQEHYKRYKEWCKKNPEPPYLDYWHWLLDHQFSEMHNGSYQWWGIKDILDEDTPEWIKTITQYFYDEFKDDLDEEGSVQVWISW